MANTNVTPDTTVAVGSVPTPTIRIDAPFTATPATLVAEMVNWGGTGSQHDFARPSAVAATGTTPTPTGLVSDRVIATTVEAVGTVGTAMPSIKADMASPDVIPATISLHDPSVSIGEHATPAVVDAVVTTDQAGVDLSQGVNPPTVMAYGTVQTPAIRHSGASIVPSAPTATATPPNASGSVSAHRTPVTLQATSPAFDGQGSISQMATPDAAQAMVIVYGDGIVRTSSIATPSTLTAICFSVPAYPLTGDPIEWEGTQQVTFTQVLGPAPYVVTPEGIQYGRVKITKA